MLLFMLFKRRWVQVQMLYGDGICQMCNMWVMGYNYACERMRTHKVTSNTTTLNA